MKMSKLFWGLIVIGAGILLLLSALGLGVEYDIFKIVGSLLLLAVSIASLAKFRFVLFFIPLALITYLWRVPLGIAGLNIALLLAAAALLGIGLSVIFRKRGHHHGNKEESNWSKTEEILNDNEFVSIESSLGENIKYIHASNLKKVKIKSNFASTKVYFDQCQISSEGLEINISGNFSEIILNIPKEWSLDNRISAFAGAVTNLATKPAENRADVRMTGSVNFAELKILYV